MGESKLTPGDNRRRRGHAPLAGYLIAMVLAAVALSRAWPPASAGGAETLHIPPWVLAIGFLVTYAWPVSFRIGSEEHNVHLTEVLKVVGLTFASPAGLVAGMVAGCVVGDWYRTRGGSPVKKVFNAVLVLLEASAAVALYSAILQGHDAMEPRGWIAAFIATTFTSIGSAVVIAGGIFVHRGTPLAVSLPRKVWLPTGLSASVNTTLGLLAVLTLVADIRSLVLVGLLLLLVKLGFQAYGGAAEDQEATTLLQELSAQISLGLDSGESLDAVVAGTRELLTAKLTELRLPNQVTDRRREWITYTAGHEPAALPVEALDALRERAREAGSFLLRRGDTGAPQEVFDRMGSSEVAVASVAVGDGQHGLLIAARQEGATWQFVPDDLRLLRIVAAHTGTALQNATLVRQLQHRLDEKEHEAAHDDLTGLANRVRFYGVLNQTILGDAPHRHAVLLIDLDGFKAVNDTMGHHAGDIVLRCVAQRLGGAVRPDDLVARLGGDEFAVLLNAVEDETEALTVAHRIYDALMQPMSCDGRRITVGASIGLALHPDDGTGAEDLLKRADAAMYRAKERQSGPRRSGHPRGTIAPPAPRG